MARDPAPSTSTGVPARLQRLARLRQPPPRLRGAILLVAGIGVAVGVVLSLRTLEVGWDDIHWVPAVLALLLITPVTVLLNAAELRVMAGIVAGRDRRLAWRAALRATVVATAANLLPLPGGALVRIAAVRRAGASTSAATGINLVGAAAWVSAGLLVAAVAAVSRAPWGPIGLAALAGVAGLAVVTALVRRLAVGPRGRGVTDLVAVETATAVVHGVRLWLVLLALGADVSLLQALTLGAAAPLAAAAGVFPSGLGLAEGLTALIAPLVAVPAAAGFAATALGRVIGLMGTAPIALAMSIDSLRHEVERAGRDTAAER